MYGSGALASLGSVSLHPDDENGSTVQLVHGVLYGKINQIL